ncbi:HAD family phosphatase [Candidatus Woesearchaeota archaeon]|nr:HAD family phosphatase [Candidatus Woesearchaeota archaeon]
MIEAVIFDWGGVLIDLPNDNIYTHIAEVLRVERGTLQDLLVSLEDSLQRGVLEERDLWERVSAELGCAVPAGSLWYDAFANAYVPHKPVFDIAKDLKRKGYSLGFLSNTEEPSMRFFRDQKYDFFDATVFSCEGGVRLRKPERRIYEVVLGRLGVEPGSAVYIDDNPSYVQGAIDAGMYAILFRDEAQLRKELVSLSVRL